MSAFTGYSSESNNPAQLVNAILASTTGLVLDPGSYAFVGEAGQVSFYDGSLAGLGVGPGILLTSGNGTPDAVNDESNHTVAWGTAGDPDLDAALVAAGFPDVSEDAAYLEFKFTVTDPGIQSIKFDIAFGSEEFPEFADDKVDIAGVFVNGTNYALFDNDATKPLSVLQRNIDGNYFRDNADGSLPIEYDGLSIPLTIVAPVHPGVNTIKIAIADTGDGSWDSGLFVSNFRSSTDAGGGIVVPPPPKRAPAAADDAVSVTEDRFSLAAQVVSGNVLANDSPVAPSAPASSLPALLVTALEGSPSAVGQPLQGRFGTLT
ncbi:MAG TPA: choice-of-anchor L domain-containing protein, partial [Microvirga sp.]|nr:choice-of-anchor L domain-containing protein [Microvirga sp.]